MIPIPRSAGALRRWLASVSVLTLGAVLASATDYYLSPSGTGASPGTLSSPLAATQLATVISGLQPGETIYLCSGDYSNAGIPITGSGTASAPKRLVGLATDSSGLPRFAGTYVPVGNVNQSTSCLKFATTASYWEFKDLRIENYGVGVSMILEPGEDYTLRSHLRFENLAFKNVQDGMRLRHVEQVTVKNCSVTGHTKKGFRIGEYSRFVTFDSCQTDAKGGDETFPTLSIPTGFCCDETDGLPIIYDIRFVNCVARNCRFDQVDDSKHYWNGDGFSSERGSYNLTFTRCQSYANHDGGFDHKAENAIFDNCVSLKNKKGWRIWGSAWLINCVGAYCHVWGGNSSADGLQIDPGGTAVIDGSTFHNAERYQLDLLVGGRSINAYHTLLTYDSSAPLATTSFGSPITLVDSAYLSSNPGYSSALNSAWEESLAKAGYFNTSSYSPLEIGYYGQGTASSLPAAPAALDATLDPTSPRRVLLEWSDLADNERDFLIERSTDNVNFAQIGTTGTNAAMFTDFGLTPGTTYYYRVRATNSMGNSAYSNTDSIATPAVTVPAAPLGLTVETAPAIGVHDDVARHPGSALLIWSDRSNNEDHFLIERSTDNVTFTQIGVQDENYPTYTDITTEQGPTYYYRVRATNSAGNSSYSNTAKIVPVVYVVDDYSNAANVTVVGTWIHPFPGANSSSLRYGDSYYQDDNTGVDGGKSVTFTPALAAAGSYNVYLWWPGGSNRATNTPIDVHHASGTATVSVDQKATDGVWNVIGTYNFSLGSTGYLKVRNDGANNFVMADAALFMPVPVGPTAPSALTATAASETQINLAWTNGTTTANSYRIEYSTDNATFTRVGSVSGSATTYACTGLAPGTTYYFRVSANGNAGYSTPSNTASAFTQIALIVDNDDPYGIALTGSWIRANAVSGSYLGYYLQDDDARGGKSVRFTPVIPETGTYQVYARWTANASNRASNARFDITHASGTATSYQSQKGNNNQWVLLGTYTFNAGYSGNVLLRDDGCDGFVIADAVKFVRVP